MLRACKVAEREGIPAIAVVATGFLRQAQATARALGIEGVWIAEYPGVIPADSHEIMVEKVRTHVVPAILEGLAAPSPQRDARRSEPERDEIVFKGTFDEVQEEFLAHQWSDGLPVVPPTPERVRRFLEFTDLDPHEVLGVLPPEHREATVWSVAVNGVMAGCRAEYMPVLVAAVEAVADPTFALEHAGATPGWEPIVVLSGSSSTELGFNTETGMLRAGAQANTSIGRFLRLYLRNVAGLRPGETDKGSLGLPTNVAIAENDEAVRRLGWQPYRVDRGFDLPDDVVTVRSVTGISMPIYSGGATPEERMEPLEHMMRTAIDLWAFSGIWYHHYHPLLVLSPDIAATFAAGGWTKDDIRNRLYERLQMPAYWLERFPFHIAGAEVKLAELVARGEAPARYASSDDPQRLVPMLQRPEWTDILVAGDPLRNQAKVLVNAHEQGVPVSKRVRVPLRWHERRNGALRS